MRSERKIDRKEERKEKMIKKSEEMLSMKKK